MIKVGSDFSGVGAFNQALMRLGIQYEEEFACDMDKYARQTFIHNYGEPKYYPTNVYERNIPSNPLDIYMTSPPCQAFSLAGKRLGKDDKRGILFFNSLEFIQINKPRFFIFENVKGLLSDDGGKTFSEWVNLLGGKSVNGNPVLFPYEDAVPYHLYWKVLNAKNYGVPQNRERVFLIGIRDDDDNKFNWPAEEVLTKRLKDVLEEEVFEKYYLSEKMVEWISNHREKRDSQNNFPMDENDIGSCVTARYFKMGAEDPYIKIKSATSKGYEEATEGDSINFSVPNSETRRGRVGKGVAQTLDTGCQQGVIIVDDYNQKVNTSGIIGTLTCNIGSKAERNGQKLIIANQCQQGVIQLNQSKESGGKQPYQQNRIYDSNALCPALNAGQVAWGGNAITLPNDYKIRRLTPRECFRLMDFPDTFTWPVSDSQAYKQAGNSIVVAVLAKIINNLNIK